MTTREIVKEVLNQYLDIMQSSDLYNRNIDDKIDIITVEIEKKLNDKRSVE